MADNNALALFLQQSPSLDELQSHLVEYQRGQQARRNERLANNLQGTWDILKDKGAGLLDYYKTPGDILAGKYNVQPEVPGQWSEMDQERANQNANDLVHR